MKPFLLFVAACLSSSLGEIRLGSHPEFRDSLNASETEQRLPKEDGSGKTASERPRNLVSKLIKLFLFGPDGETN
jgi:hypothetical protein